MRMRTFLALLIVVMAPIGWADEPMLLTLEQSVQLALENNPELAMAEKEVDKAGAGVGEAYATVLPTLDAYINAEHAWDVQTSTMPNFIKPMLEPLAPSIPEVADMPDFLDISFGLENTLSYGASLTQPLFLGGAGIAGIQLAKAMQDAGEYDLESVQQNLIYQTVRSFYGCILARELVRVQENALDQAEANLDVVAKHHAVGSASGFDLMRAEVEVANLKPGVIASRNAHQSAKTGLKTVLGMDPDTRVDVAGELIFELDNMDQQSLSELQHMAYENRPELSALHARKRAAGNSITLARSEFLPKVLFSTNYSFLGNRDDWDFRQNEMSKGFTSAVSVQLPLFDGFRNRSHYQKAQLDYRIMEDAERQIIEGVAAEVELAFNGFGEAEEKYMAANESIELAREALRLANLMYEEGATTQLDVLSSHLALLRAEVNHVSAMFEYQMARYELRRTTGTLSGLL